MPGRVFREGAQLVVELGERLGLLVHEGDRHHHEAPLG
jgi:hypothetical protein